jgi:hypothetical protein
MKPKSLVLASVAALLVSQSVLAAAQTTNSSRSRAPGQQFHEKGSVREDPGASGYSPGDLKNDRGSKPGSPGASGYGPGRSTSQPSTRSGTSTTGRTR